MGRHKLILLVALFASGVEAGTATGLVSSIDTVIDSNSIAFTLDTAIEDTPRCNETKRFAIDLGKPGGGALLQSLLLAKQENYTVTVVGLNTCGFVWKAENTKSIMIQ